MCKTWGLLAAALLATWVVQPASADDKAKVRGQEITFKSGDEEIKGFLAEPEGKGPFPAIVVIQEWWGLTDWIKQNAERLAGQGYVTLAPDLYRGKVAHERSTASELLKGMPRDRALRDLKAAVDTLAGKDNVQKNQIGSIGWCMGGGYSLQAALHDPRVKACVMCYGPPVSNPGELKSLKAEVLGAYGADDKGIPARNVHNFMQALNAAGKKFDRIKIYDGAGHGFMRPNDGPDKPNPEYRAEAAKDAWERIDKFFSNELGGG